MLCFMDTPYAWFIDYLTIGLTIAMRVVHLIIILRPDPPFVQPPICESLIPKHELATLAAIAVPAIGMTFYYLARQSIVCDADWSTCFIWWAIPIGLFMALYHYHREAFYGAILPVVYLCFLLVIGLTAKIFIGH